MKKIIAGLIIISLVTLVVIITDGGGIGDIGSLFFESETPGGAGIAAGIGAMIFIVFIQFIWRKITSNPKKEEDE